MDASIQALKKTKTTSIKTLNKEQQEFFNYVYTCIMKNEKKIITVNSPGGTGKTFCVKEIVKKFPEYTTILAPTNKAASLFLPILAQTIHRFFNAKSDYDDDGELQFNFDSNKTNGNGNGNNFHLLIIDECSMITRDMVSIFMNYIQMKNCLMIFMGDNCQLPPVNETCSPVFQMPGTKHFNFVQNMRIQNIELTEICDFFRNQFLHPENCIFNINVLKEKFKFVSFENAIQEFIHTKDCVYLTWTNKKKENVSKIVRQLLFSDNVSNQLYYTSEKLVFSGYRNTSEENYLYAQSETKSNISKKISTDSLDMIQTLNQHRCISSNSQKYYSNDIVEICNVEIVNIHIKLTYKTFHLNFYKIIDQNETIWLKPATDTIQTISNYFKNQRDYIKTIKNQTEKKNSWWNYYLQKKLIDPDLDYTYASTVHKAQGSQWKVVLVDYYSINYSNERKQLLYTAVSRAIEKVVLTN